MRWNTTKYTPTGFTTATLPENLFQNRTFVRVDRPPPLASGAEAADIDLLEQLSNGTIKLALDSRPVWTLQRARDALRKRSAKVSGDDDELVRQLAAFDVVPLYTFSDESVSPAAAFPSCS